ncbi:hypothetical protein BU15DRAFT_67182 [Melanogaster broomeanus]|nr:hypothetical protein BU15DRAFT_67182 [Melanogaster broomeanus]
MSSASKSITPAFPASGVDWTRFKTPELDSDIDDNDEVATAKAKERRRRKVEKKRCEDEERRLQEEEEKRRQEEEEKRRREEEAELRKREEEQRAHEEVQKKAAEANKKRMREEAEAGSSAARGPRTCHCLRCARAGVPCVVTTDGNKRRKACDRCSHMKEKKGKAREVPMSPRQGEKKKRVHKAKVQDDDKVEIVGEKRSGAGPSRISLDQLVMAIEEMSDRMGELTQAHRESTQVHRESTLASRKARRAFEVFVDEATICGVPEESASESEEEEVDEGEIDEEIAGLEEDVAENPMSPPAV